VQPLADWDSFYVIVGTAAGALIGLQFVALTLIASSAGIVSPAGASAYTTPTTIHFSVAFFLSAMLRAPWPSISVVAIIPGAIGLGGTIYAAIVWRRMTRQSNYQAEAEDWLFHAWLPLAAHLLFVLSAAAVPWVPREALFGVAAATLLLVLTGIHNSWDIVTYHVFVNMRRQAAPKDETKS
jgi:hypothetical protein